MHDHEGGRCRQLFDLISPYLDKELEEGSCEEIAQHMAGCEACRRYVESMRATKEVLHRLGERDEVPAGQADSLLQACLGSVRDRLKA